MVPSCLRVALAVSNFASFSNDGFSSLKLSFSDTNELGRTPFQCGHIDVTRYHRRSLSFNLPHLIPSIYASKTELDDQRKSTISKGIIGQ